jgi:WD40 repeat protein/serine/threonine protein kinase
MATISLVGRKIKGYELVEAIGVGSFGEVYRARQSYVNREVAIKIILAQYANQPEFIRRFESEAQLVARLEHPFIVPLYDYWREPSGAYLVMRFLRGGSLRDIVYDNPLDLDTIARILEQIGAALTVAHQNGVIHRDLKPANIMLDEAGNAYLTDFGIAKDLFQASDATLQGSLVGSPAYISPEQVRSEPVVPQSDIYSLGIMLYEMLTGKKPFPNESISGLLVKHLNDPLPNIRIERPQLREEINLVVQRATAKNYKNRYANPLQLAAAFRRAAFPDASEASSSSVSIATKEFRKSDRATFDPITESTQDISESFDIELPPPENPYKGLRAFQESDAIDFFGRQALIEQLVRRLRENHPLGRFLAVVGPSGSGKSSVVKAGLMPAIRRGDMTGAEKWFVTEMVPGAYPFEELEAALLRVAVNPPESLLSQLREDDSGLLRATKRVLPIDPQTEILLVIDQFEELFTLVEDENLRTRFMNSLVKAFTDPHSRLRVVLTLRADFYDRPLFYKEFGEVIRQRTEVVLPMSAEEMGEAITRPAERVGLRLERGLLNEIIQDVGEQAGSLPLLQYAMTELFERRSERLLTLSAYREIGGVSGALARRAEALYQELDEHEKDAARQIFLRLVSLGDGTEDTRRRVHQSELLGMSEGQRAIQEVITAFGKYRLFTFDNDPQTREPTVEVAHEALLRRWERLREWVDERREDLRQRARLNSNAEEWTRSGQDHSYLLTGTRLAQVEEWRATTDLVLNERELSFINASLKQRDAALSAEKERQAREEQLERRARQGLIALVGVLALGLVAAIGLTLFALNERSVAQRNEELALQQQAIAQSLVLVANARNELAESEPNLALSLAIEASQATTPPLVEAERILSIAAYGPAVRYRMEGHSASVTAVAFSGDGRFAISASADNTLIVWDLSTGQAVRKLERHTRPVTSVAMAPDDSFAVSGSVDGTAIVWDWQTGKIISQLRGHTEMINSVAISPDSRFVLTGAGNGQVEPSDRTARLWDLSGGRTVLIMEHNAAVLSVNFTPDGRFALTTSGAPINAEIGDRRLGWLWNLETGENTVLYRGFTGFPRHIVPSPDGKEVAIGTWDSANAGTIRIFDRNTGVELRRLFTHPNIITRLAYFNDGERIASASWDGTVRVWNVKTGVQLAEYGGHGERVVGLAISPDGSHLLSSTGNFGNVFEVERSADKSIRYWDLQNRATELRLTGPQDWVWSVAYSPDDSVLAVGSGSLFDPDKDNLVRLYDTSTGELVRQLAGHTHSVDDLEFIAGGAQLLSGAWDNTVRRWDVATGESLHVYEGHENRVYALAVAADESVFYSVSDDGTVWRWNLADDTGEVFIPAEVNAEGKVIGLRVVNLSPDGQTLVVGNTNSEIILYDLQGQEIRRLTGHINTIEQATFSPDGRLILSVSRDGTARLWEAATGTQVRQLIGHVGVITDGTFTPDGTRLITTGSDRTVRVWQTESGQELRRYEGHTDWANSVDITQNAQTFATGSNDLSTRIWRLDANVAAILDWARANRYIQPLTCQQRADLRLDMLDCP